MSDFCSGFGSFEMPDTIYVLDTETTGLNGGKYIDNPFDNGYARRGTKANFDDIPFDELDWSRYGDLIVDIGICEVSLSKHTVREVYSSIIGYDTSTWTEEMQNAWIFENSDLDFNQISEAKPFSEVRGEVSALLKDKWVTSYNVQFDLDRFLYRFPWNLKNSFMECRDIMLAAKDVCKLRSENHPGEYRYPKLDYAYEILLEGEDPAGINGVQDHRALSDARVASHLMLNLNDRGLYSSLDMSGRHGHH